MMEQNSSFNLPKVNIIWHKHKAQKEATFLWSSYP